MRPFVSGAVAGFGLSWLRLAGPLGPLDLPVPPAGDALLVRALALGALAAGFAAGERERRGPGADPAPSFGPRSAARLALGACLGFAAHALLLADGLAAGGTFGALLVALALVLALRVAASGPSAEVEPRAARAGATARRRLGPLELLALLALGAALALLLEALGRWARLLTPGSREDDALLAVVLLALVALGAASFGWLLGPQARRAALAPGLLAAAGAATLAGWRVIGNLADPTGLTRYFRHPLLALLGIDGSYDGTLAYDLAVGSSVLVVPALVLGAALAAVDTRARLASLLAGAALGLLAFPHAFAAATLEGRTAPELARFALLAASAAAALACFARRLPGPPRLAGLALCAVSAALALPRRPVPHPPVEPGRPRPAVVERAAELPEGVLALERTAAGRAAMLAGLWIAPQIQDLEADERALAEALALAPRPGLGREGLSVLVVGQLTPRRAAVLAAGGATRVDRTASWWRAMGLAEAELFEGAAPPDGARLAPAEARRRWREGAYDLVAVPPVRGVRGPALGRFAKEAARTPDTAAIAWLDPRTPLADEELGARLAFAQSNVEQWRVGVARLAESVGEDESPLVLPAGEPGGSALPLTRLRLRREERGNRARVDLAERIAHASAGTPAESFAEGLLALARAQRPSSPFESRAEQVELPAEALAAWKRAAERTPLDRTTRELWEGLAALLAEKRAVEELYGLEPLVARHHPWPEVERALAYGELEGLEAEKAAARLEEVVRARPLDGASWGWLGEARRMAGDHAGAAEAYRRAAELLPKRPLLERALAIELMRSGDPEGRRRIEALLAEDPEDESLRSWLAPGPRTDPEPGLRPDLLRKGLDEH
jgi:tetratricopeptide (TPR) repeat protein